MAPLDPRVRARLRLALAGATLAAVIAASAARLAPPPAAAPDAPADAFSGARAAEVLRALAGAGSPRPAGSAADAAAAAALAARFRALGLETSEQAGVACGAWGVCARGVNVAARIPAAPGRERARAVLLVAHHDSVPAGPGISDDLTGVAVLLEVARALRAGPPPPRPVLLLSTDGEEIGLAGATAFAARHPWAREVGAVVNLEARGTGGPSVMFDTAGDAAFLVDAVRRLPRPVTTSIAPAVYDLLPNDTDLTVLEAAGMVGLNFAFAEGVVRYHTPLDDLAHAAPGSLQHQGENALAAVRALAAADLEHPVPGRAVFFDLFALGVVAWPERASAALAAAALALALAAAALVRARLRVRLRAVAAGIATSLLAPVLAAALGLAVAAALSAIGAAPRPFVAHPAPLLAAVWCASLAGALGAAALGGGLAGAEGMLAGGAILNGALALAAARAFPAAGYLFLVPGAASAVGALAWAGSRREAVGTAALAVAALAAGAVLAPMALLLPPMLGLPAAPVVAALAALAALPAASAAASLPRGARWWAAGAAGAGAVVAGAVAALVPHATVDAPERMTIAWHEEARGGRWLVEAEGGRLPGAMRDLAPFSERAAPGFPWLPIRPVFSAAAPPLGLALPRAVVRSSEQVAEGRRIRVHLASRRGAPILLLAVGPEVSVVRVAVEGVPAPPRAPKTRVWNAGWLLAGSATAPAAGIELELVVGSREPFDAVVVDESPGLPRAAAPLVAARPRTGVPSWDGDLTVATSPVRL